jgi:hypothetical protein
MMPATDIDSVTWTVSTPFPMLLIVNAIVSAVLGDAGLTVAAAATVLSPALKATVIDTEALAGV